MRDLLASNGEKKEKLELKEDPNKGVYIKVFYVYAAYHEYWRVSTATWRANSSCSVSLVLVVVLVLALVLVVVMILVLVLVKF